MWCSMSGAIRYVTGGEGEMRERVDRTVGVRATGENIAREPVWRRTVLVFASANALPVQACR